MQGGGGAWWPAINGDGGGGRPLQWEGEVASKCGGDSRALKAAVAEEAEGERARRGNGR